MGNSFKTIRQAFKIAYKLDLIYFYLLLIQPNIKIITNNLKKNIKIFKKNIFFALHNINLINI